jgi:hypothetical protein
VAKHVFLSDEWLAAVDELVDAHGPSTPPGTEIVMNVTVTDLPAGITRELHVGSSDGHGHWGLGHAPDADVSLTTDYPTARELFVAGDPAVGMQAFLSGRVRVQGDLAKLLGAQAAAAAAAGGEPSALQLAIEELTA